MITAESRYNINTRHISHDVIDNEVIIIHLVSGSYYSIVREGALIWTGIGNNSSISQIVDLIRDNYFEDGISIDEGLYNFVGKLLSEALIEEISDTGDGISKNLSSTKNISLAQDDKPDFKEPELNIYTDMQALLLLDPIHEVDEAGWPISAEPENPTEASSETPSS